jgi:hypothetical protein
MIVVAPELADLGQRLVIEAFGRRDAFRCAGGAGRTEPQRSFRRRIDTFAD